MVGDDDERFSRHKPADGRLYGRLVLGIGEGGRFVENDDGRILQHRPGYGDALALAAREPRPRAADAGVVACRQGAYELMAACALRGFLDLRVGCIGFAHADVLAD